MKSDNLTVSERLYEVALDRGLRQSSLLCYKRILAGMGLLDLTMAEATLERVTEALWAIDNPNTRRGAVIACRTVFGYQIRIPRSIPRQYDLPDEDSLRLALMTSPYEIRGLLMMYGGLRLGEACAITSSDLTRDRLRVDKQIQALRDKGKPTVIRVAPVKSHESDVVIPHWLTVQVKSITETDKPDAVRESLRRAGNRVGVQLNPQLLRTWHGTELLRRGVNIKTVSRQLRHSDITTTLRHYIQINLADDIHDAFG